MRIIKPRVSSDPKYLIIKIIKFNDTYTTGFSVIQNKALVAGAHKATKSISTMTILTNILVFLAFVDVL